MYKLIVKELELDVLQVRRWTITAHWTVIRGERDNKIDRIRGSGKKRGWRVDGENKGWPKKDKRMSERGERET